MNRSEVPELHYISSITNVPSILTLGVLSHRAVAKLPHDSVADPVVQQLREVKKVPPWGRSLHSYVNLFFHARNSMMYTRKGRHADLCVLRIRTDVLDLPGVVIAERNAAAAAAFLPPAKGLPLMDKELVFARSWDHQDWREKQRRKQIRSAEVLVPDRVAPEYIAGAYVSCGASEAALRAIAPALPIVVDADLFFR